MASDFVRKVKGIRNIDILSPNITTENDLISTIDGKVYVATNKGYKKITGSDTEQDIQVLETDVKNLKTSTANNTSEIGTLKTTTENNTSEIDTLTTSTGNNTSEIDTLKTKTDDNTTLINSLTTQLEELRKNTKQYYTLFEGGTNGVGSTIPLNDDYTTFDLIYISGEFPRSQNFTETILVKSLIDNIYIQRINLRDSDGTFLGVYEIKLTPTSNNELEIINDVSWDELGSKGSGQDRNAFTITNIEGVK